jgi:hypothetical protein
MKGEYFVVCGEYGVTRFEDDDSMTGIGVNKDRGQWVVFDENQARAAASATGYKIIEIGDCNDD